MKKREELKALRLDLANQAHASWLDAQKKGAKEKSFTPDRIENFVVRENIRKTIMANAPAIQPLERMIGPTLDFRDQPPHELARRKGRPVARIHEYVPDADPEGFGTGFLVAPNILITNYHVFPSKDFAVDCAANFLYEKDGSNRTMKGITFLFRPEIFFFNNEDLDYALVYVDSDAVTGTAKLSELGILPMIGTKGKIIEGSPINIIQYPLGGPKKYAYEQNMVTAIDDRLGIIQYTTDTQVASSGSPAFNEAWEVAALHYTGVPSIVDGKWRTKTGEVWDKSMSESDVLWIANAGKSISKIVAHLTGLKSGDADLTHISAILNNSNDPLMTPVTESLQKNKPDSFSRSTINTNSMEPMILNFNGPTTVYINQPGTIAHNGQSKMTASEVFTESILEKKLRFDESYSTRKGYDPDFLDGFKVPLPTVIASRDHELYKPLNATKPLILKYHHYSLVMNKKRRFLMWSAVNVDYSETARENVTAKNLETTLMRGDSTKEFPRNIRCKPMSSMIPQH
jgi:endonuclease G, mitochondrial